MKLKHLKYQAVGIESPRPGLELAIPLIFLFGIVPLCMVLIGLVLMYADRIDSIPPVWQLIFTVVALAIPMGFSIVRIWKTKVLNK